MRRTLCLMILTLIVGACSDDGPVIVSDPAEMRVVKVSGDQSAPVPAVAPSRIVAVAGTSLDAVPGDGWTPEPLVARVEATGVASRGTGPGPVIPPGTLVHWQIPEGAGQIYGQTTATDDSAYVINRWAPGTRAGEYTVQAGRLVGGTIVTDATWELVVEPGEPHSFTDWGAPAAYPRTGSTAAGCEDCVAILTVGDTLHFVDWWETVTDQYGNPITKGSLTSATAPRLHVHYGDFSTGGQSMVIELESWSWVVEDIPDAWGLAIEAGELLAMQFVEIRLP